MRPSPQAMAAAEARLRRWLSKSRQYKGAEGDASSWQAVLGTKAWLCHEWELGLRRARAKFRCKGKELVVTGFLVRGARSAWGRKGGECSCCCVLTTSVCARVCGWVGKGGGLLQFAWCTLSLCTWLGMPTGAWPFVCHVLPVTSLAALLLLLCAHLILATTNPILCQWPSKVTADVWWRLPLLRTGLRHRMQYSLLPSTRVAVSDASLGVGLDLLAVSASVLCTHTRGVFVVVCQRLIIMLAVLSSTQTHLSPCLHFSQPACHSSVHLSRQGSR